MLSLCLNESTISTLLHDISPLESFAKVVKYVKLMHEWIYYKHPFTWHITRIGILWKMKSWFTMVITYDYLRRHLIHDCCHSQSLKKCKIWIFFVKQKVHDSCYDHELWGTIKFVSNKRLQFMNGAMKDLFTHFVIKHKFTTVYEPSKNDVVERTNKIFCSMLLKK
jgi:hypothetical protein